MRAKLVAIVAILWVAAVGAISIAFVANRDEVSSSKLSACLDSDTPFGECVKLPHEREFSWGGWLAWTGTITLVAVVVLAIILILVKRDASAEVG